MVRKLADVREIEQAIEAVRDGRPRRGTPRERRTKVRFTDPMLEALGWRSDYGPGHVVREYRTNKRNRRRVDYALLPAQDDAEGSTGPLAVIEAKRWGTNLPNHERQLLNYVRGLRLRTGYGVLTDGNHWLIYDLAERDPDSRSLARFREARIADFSILSSPTEECVQHLKLLHRRNLR